MYTYQTTVKLYDTDGAGLLFFGNHFRLVHDAYEAFLNSRGLSLGDVIRQGEYVIPIVHSEADYHESLTVGDQLTIELRCERITEHSFTLVFHLLSGDRKLVATVKTVHVFVGKEDNEKRPIPDDFRRALEKLS